MATVISVKPAPSKKRVQITILESGEEYTYTVTEATYKTLGSPLCGYDISVADLGTIRFEDEYIRALKKAADYLSAGFSAEASDVAIERLSELGYLDEERQLERAVEREANYNLRGRHYIKRKLASKGYSSSAISRAIDALVGRDEIDFDANFEDLAAKKGVFSDEDRLALAYKFGYKI